MGSLFPHYLKMLASRRAKGKVLKLTDKLRISLGPNGTFPRLLNEPICKIAELLTKNTLNDIIRSGRIETQRRDTVESLRRRRKAKQLVTWWTDRAKLQGNIQSKNYTFSVKRCSFEYVTTDSRKRPHVQAVTLCLWRLAREKQKLSPLLALFLFSACAIYND